MALIVRLQFASRHLKHWGHRGFLRHPILIDSGPRLKGSQPFRTEILRVCSPPSFIGIELKIGGGDVSARNLAWGETSGPVKSRRRS